MAWYLYVYRSSITGRFVTYNYAKQHPKTTERERRARPAYDRHGNLL